MKVIGFFNSTHTWGGGEKWHFDVAVYLAQKNYAVHFFVTKDSELHRRLNEYSDICLHFIAVKSLSFLNPFAVASLKEKLRSAKVHALFVSLSTDLKLAGNAGTAVGSRVIYVRAVPIPVRNTFLNRYIFSHWVDCVLANSMATAKSVLKNNPDLISREKIKVIYNPIQTVQFINRSYEKVYERKGDEIIIGCAGRIETEKNHRFFIGLSMALDAKAIPHKILIAGTGRLEQELKAIAGEKGVSDNFLFTGFLDNVKNLLESCDIFILPSLFEGFGFVLAEASLCQKPVIAFDTSSVPEIVVDAETGYIVPVNDTRAVVERVIMLKSDIQLQKKLGEAGRIFVTTHFNEEHIMAQIEELI